MRDWLRIAVTGKQGQVVSSLVERGALSGAEIIAVGRPELDLIDHKSIRASLLKIKPDAIVSAAAYTAVDKAESEEALAFAVNAHGPTTVAEVANELGIPIVHLSTDYVFTGDKDGFYNEADETGPVSAYGRSKLAGELGVAAANPNHAILRTAWVYSPFGANFMKTMLRLAETRDSVNVVADQFGTPTSALDIADAVISVARRLSTDLDPKLRGVFHLTGGGEATWADFAEMIFSGLHARSGKHVSIGRITAADYPTPAKRPANSRLSNEKLKQTYGITAPDWKESAKVVLDRLL
ncbi:dTDP-4-dehydrorhamnose reductase [Rhizobium sp. PDO1-076]|uniref:dTDP-4-dehydrorhamnose reductase n=1 Tax=Rhizobium sp. PDO1-076 TaxID=1125979 RepID=UPI00024E2566|nr:dTDP-4-dehydrorhamnose reductase [Rhizobium sp. PDO1-076]EHS53131.1 dTDP-4-dehydrorhamnose reductase [Rhizobium sp. PDO1-076]